MANENKLEEIIRTSLESIRSMVDANTVIGAPITTENGVTIIPISKISVGYASGGLDFNGKNKADAQNFGAGGGTGISINPIGFLVIKKDGGIEMVNVGDSYPVNPLDQISEIIDRTPSLFNKVKSLFKKDKTSNEPDEEPIEELTDEELDEIASI